MLSYTVYLGIIINVIILVLVAVIDNAKDYAQRQQETVR